VDGRVAKFPPSIRNNELLMVIWSLKIKVDPTAGLKPFKPSKM
jgi:hypothetical protein